MIRIKTTFTAIRIVRLSPHAFGLCMSPGTFQRSNLRRCVFGQVALEKSSKLVLKDPPRGHHSAISAAQKVFVDAYGVTHRLFYRLSTLSLCGNVRGAGDAVHNSLGRHVYLRSWYCHRNVDVNDDGYVNGCGWEIGMALNSVLWEWLSVVGGVGYVSRLLVGGIADGCQVIYMWVWLCGIAGCGAVVDGLGWLLFGGAVIVFGCGVYGLASGLVNWWLGESWGGLEWGNDHEMWEGWCLGASIRELDDLWGECEDCGGSVECVWIEYGGLGWGVVVVYGLMLRFAKVYKAFSSEVHAFRLVFSGWGVKSLSTYPMTVGLLEKKVIHGTSKPTMS
ncbi:hypothetical protein Tco_1538643 [Tanacetum coccineum]